MARSRKPRVESIMKVDRYSLSKKLREVITPRLQPVPIAGPAVLTSGGAGTAARSLDDGRVLWRDPAVSFVGDWRDKVAVVNKRELEFRAWDTGAVTRTCALPWPADGRLIGSAGGRTVEFDEWIWGLA